MKKKLYLLFLTITLIIQYPLLAQEEYFKPGAEWYYSAGYGLLQLRGHSLVKYTGDTIIDGYNLKKIDRTFFSFDLQDPTIPIDTFYSDPRYYMQAGDSILNYDNGEFTLQWIMGLEAGDVFRIDEKWDSLGDWDVYVMIVDSTENVTIDGIETRKMYIEGGVIYDYFGDTLFTNLSGSEIIYDKFGPVHGFAYWTCWGFLDCGPGSLCRYVSDETGRVEINTGQQCETLLTAAEEIQKATFNIYPNPCHDYIVVEQIYEQPDARLEIFSQTGIQLLSVAIPGQKNVVDVSMLPAGIYFARVHSTYGVAINKVVKN